MTLIKPPTFRELVETYGSPRAAVLHLLNSGWTPEDISWKMEVPYHLVRLFMRNVEPVDRIPFSEIAETYERLAVLRSRKGKETELVKFFKRRAFNLEMKARLALGKITDESLRIGPGVVERAIAVATGESSSKLKSLLVDYGEYGEVAFLLLKPKKPSLTTKEVYESIKILPELETIKERDLLIISLLETSTPQEGKYLVRLLLLDLKLGYNQRTVIQAVARAYTVPTELVENVCAIIGIVEGITLASKGIPALQEVKTRPGQFFKPQLAQLYQADKIAYPALAELKLDGSRLQIHKWGTRIWLYSRRGVEKANALPEIIEIVKKFKAQSCIIDSEVIAIDPNGHLLPFQKLLERTTSKQPPPDELSKTPKKVEVTVSTFDIIYLNGIVLSDVPLSERRKHLAHVVPSPYMVEGKECRSEVELMQFYEDSLHRGYEGIVVKDLKSRYEFGQRTCTWLKLKPERDTIDCTLVKAFYGKGRRSGLFSSFLMAVRDPTKRKLFTIGKVSNLPESTLQKLRTVVEETKIDQDDEGVVLKPTIIIEVTYQEIQSSEEYTSKYALRVPKVVRFRQDKTVEEIDDLQKIGELYELQYERQTVRWT